jgi:hypothetical protein
MFVAAAASAAVSAKGAYDQAKVARGTARNNATMAEYGAQDAERRGEEEAQRINRQRSQMVGAQRAGFSARGIDIGAGTAADILDQTDFFGQTDALAARNNAAKEAWGLRAQKSSFQATADNARPGQAGAMSLLGSAGSVATSWYGMQGGGGTDHSRTGADIRARR